MKNLIRALIARLLIRRVDPRKLNDTTARYYNRCRAVIITKGRSNVKILPLMFKRLRQ